MVPILENRFRHGEWHWVLSFLEFLLAELGDLTNCGDRLTDSFNEVFRVELVGFRIIDGLVVPDPGEIESNTIIEALKSPLKVVHDHIRRSVEFLAQKPHADYRNSIRESISAVEALCKTITHDRSADLEDALKELNKIIQFHPCFKLSLIKLYAYTSDGGMRHAQIEEENGKWSDVETAKFMLTATSAFVRLISEKARLADLPPFNS
jgi:AbiJ N-terminal domain 4